MGSNSNSQPTAVYYQQPGGGMPAPGIYGPQAQGYGYPPQQAQPPYYPGGAQPYYPPPQQGGYPGHAQGNYYPPQGGYAGNAAVAPPPPYIYQQPNPYK